MFGKEKEKAFEDDDSDSAVSCSNRSFNRNEVLLCATHGKIYAIHKEDGARLWRAKFPTGAMGGIVSLFVTDYDRLIVGGNGKTACMDLFTGETIWVNKMKGCGYDEVGVISTSSRILSPRRHDMANEAEEDAPPDYDEGSNDRSKPIILGCTRGKCVAIDASSGEQLWKYNCPKGGYNMPVALVEPSSAANRQRVFVGCGKWVYCIQATTGEVVWSTKISNSMMGLGYMTLATPWSSRLAAEAHTAFSQFPTAQAHDVERQQRSSGGGGSGGGG
ncbi:quinon protein alcohol dehydrogenase-like superfamily [Syncephalastrum racemosum]|uniref:Quinon protein alcohol dehydrogenase-like superfamily n=1 Tax=Syncephalastrum racemosum TaxID=13706 RepID=A0A1X2HG08_SYNRA|nr:quinon protein alcohol dehydrogenase-like superfamily [Syncephalastrum racemosum]